MKEVDLALMVLLGIFAVRGFLRGFFRESFGLFALVAGLVCALQFTEVALPRLGSAFDLPESTRAIVAFIAIFMAVYCGGTLTGFLLERLLGSLLFRSVSGIAGALFGVGKGAALLAFVLLFLHLFPIAPGFDEEVMRSSVGRPMVDIAGTVLREQWRGFGESADRT